jgi:hypothetical protein
MRAIFRSQRKAETARLICLLFSSGDTPTIDDVRHHLQDSLRARDWVLSQVQLLCEILDDQDFIEFF